MTATTEHNPTSTITDGPSPAAAPGADRVAPAADGSGLVEQDLLVEDVSIDGMCGVY
jgi:mycofactocin precursor